MAVNIPKSISLAYEKERKTLEVLYARFDPGVEARDMSSKKLGAELGLGDQVGRYIALFEELGILRRRMEYGNVTTNGLPFGRHYHWTLMRPRPEAFALLEESQAKRRSEAIVSIEAGHRQRSKSQRGRPKARPVTPKVTLATDEKEEVRAIAGEEPDRHLGALMNTTIKNLRKNDAAALVEAARQYSKRTHSIDTKIDELAKLAAEVGISFDREKALSAVQYETDERLEAIADLLPYIDKLEATVERISNQLVTQSGKVRDYDTMAAENKRLRERVTDLISRNTGQKILAAQTQ